MIWWWWCHHYHHHCAEIGNDMMMMMPSSSSLGRNRKWFDLLRHRLIAIVSWGVNDLFFLVVCSWGRVSTVWYCPFFQGSWSSFGCIWVSRLAFQRSLVFFFLYDFASYFIQSCDICDIFVNCSWVATRWQQNSTHLHTDSTQNRTMKQNTQKGIYRTVRIHKQ